MASDFSIQSIHLLNTQVSKSPQIPSFSILNFISTSSVSPQFRVSITCCLSIKNPNSLPIPSSSSPPISSRKHSYEVSYLIKTFGWTPQFAISKARFLNFKSPERPERVVNFFKNHGFSDTQIADIIKKAPRLLHSDPEKTFLPKLEFLRSLGLSTSEITRFVTQAPILRGSLEDRIVPAFNLVSYLVDSDDEAIEIIKQYPKILLDNLDFDGVKILREVGVPNENIVASMKKAYRLYWPKPDVLRKVVLEVKEMGYDPRSMMFLSAIRTIKTMSKSTWEDKVLVLKKYGWSDHEIRLAYRYNPQITGASKDKIDGIIDFLVNKMGIEAIRIANYPSIFTLSLEKRIIPRCLVYQTLLEKGLWKRKLSIPTLCNYPENTFITRFIKPFQNEAPEILDLYKELLDLGNEI